MYAAGFTDVGVTRSQNQDTIFVCNKPIGPLPNLFIVADGMGGHNAGDVASALAVEHICNYVRDFVAAEFLTPEHYLDLLVTATQQAGNEIIKKATAEPEMHGMGTTLTACVLTNEKIYLAHVGDSRAYAITQLGMTRLTTDHTFVEELLQTGRVSEEEARTHPKRHVLTKVLGVPGVAEIDGIVRELNDTAAILLCSDGLSNMLDEESMMRIINGLGYVETRAQCLIAEANRRGSADNVSAVLVDVGR